jgi:site-specific recombinase XerD
MARKNDWTPPRGIRLETRADRPKPYLVRIHNKKTGKYSSESFETKEAQIHFAKIHAKNRDMPQIDLEKWQRWCEFEKRIGGIENLDRIEGEWINRQAVIKMGVSAAVEDFIRHKGLEGIDYGTIKRYQNYLGQFSRAFPGRSVSEIDENQIIDWLQSLKSGRKAMNPLTKDNYRKFLKTFFIWCGRKRLLSENPMERVPVFKAIENPVEILTLDEGRKLFEANKDQPCIGRLALEAFAGLRFSSAKVIEKKDLIFEEKGIHLPAQKIKTRRRVYVDGFPENLWQWLLCTPQDAWRMSARQYQEAKRHAFLRANIRHPRNCLRHSFCTYHIAAFKDVGKTATLLCHTSLDMLNRHYRGNATHENGRLWFQIVP